MSAPLDLAHLPRTSGRRTPGDKEAVVVAIRRREISADEACARFALTPEELNAWALRFRRHGRPGLSITRLQETRP